MAELWRCHGDGLRDVSKLKQPKGCTDTKEGYWNIPVSINWSRWNCLYVWLLYNLSQLCSWSWCTFNTEWTVCACLCLPLCLSICSHVCWHTHAHGSHSLSKNYAYIQYYSRTAHLIVIWDLTLTFPHYIFLPFCLAQIRGFHEIIRLVSKTVPVHYMKAYGRVEVWLHSFLTLALAGGEWSAS